MTRSRRKRAVPQAPVAPCGDDPYLSPREPLLLTVYLRHRLLVRRRPGSAIDLRELNRRVTFAELKAERRTILKRSIQKVRGFARREHMTVSSVDYLGRTMTLRARAADVERAFSTRLMWIDQGGERRRYPRRKPRLPKHLKPFVHAILGLDTRKPKLS